MIGITKAELRTIIRQVFLERFVESDEEYLEMTIDQIVEEVEQIETIEDEYSED